MYLFCARIVQCSRGVGSLRKIEMFRNITLESLHSILYSVHFGVNIVQCPLYSVQCSERQCAVSVVLTVCNDLKDSVLCARSSVQ